MDFKDAVVWVTGASSGIGAAIAIYLSRKGAKLVLSGRNEERLLETKALMEKSHTDAEIAKVLKFDVVGLDSEKAGNLAKAAVSKFGKINYMVHSAGISNRG